MHITLGRALINHQPAVVDEALFTTQRKRPHIMIVCRVRLIVGGVARFPNLSDNRGNQTTPRQQKQRLDGCAKACSKVFGLIHAERRASQPEHLPNYSPRAEHFAQSPKSI